jgi:hypothetical protein
MALFGIEKAGVDRGDPALSAEAVKNHPHWPALIGGSFLLPMFHNPKIDPCRHSGGGTINAPAGFLLSRGQVRCGLRLCFSPQRHGLIWRQRFHTANETMPRMSAVTPIADERGCGRLLIHLVCDDDSIASASALRPIFRSILA